MAGKGEIKADMKAKFSDDNIWMTLEEAEITNDPIYSSSLSQLALAKIAFNRMIDERWMRYYAPVDSVHDGAVTELIRPDDEVAQ